MRDIKAMLPEEIAAAETALLPTDSLQRPAGEDGCSLGQLIPGAEIEEQIIETVSLRAAMTAEPSNRAATISRHSLRPRPRVTPACTSPCIMPNT